MTILWSPEGRPSEMRRFAERHGFDDYEDLLRWSVTDLEGFWRGVADFYSLDLPGPVLTRREMPGAVWFPEATLNYAEHMLPASDEVAVVQRPDARELHVQRPARAGRGCAGGAAASSAWAKGDRVVAFLPNRPETLVALLACAVARRDLGERLAGVRPAQRDRPLRADRAEGAARRRRLRAPRQVDRPPR